MKFLFSLAKRIGCFSLMLKHQEKWHEFGFWRHIQQKYFFLLKKTNWEENWTESKKECKKSVLKVNGKNMPSSCGPYGSTNRGNENREVSFHSLPSQKKASLRAKWLQNIRREGKIPKALLVCSEHFEKDCFKRDFKVIELLLTHFYILQYYMKNHNIQQSNKSKSRQQE